MTAFLSDYRFWILAGALLAAAWGFTLWRRRLADRPIDNPKHLFRDLCWAHDLTRREMALLRALAQQHKLATPALLFLEPSHFDIATLGPGWVPQAARIAELRDRLFLSELDEAVTRA